MRPASCFASRGAYQGPTLDELQWNLQEVIAILLEDEAPRIESESVGIQTVRVAYFHSGKYEVVVAISKGEEGDAWWALHG